MNTVPISLWTMFTLFLRIGSTAFGGFMALIAVVESHVVERRKLFTHEEMLDGISLATVLPALLLPKTAATWAPKVSGGVLVQALRANGVRARHQRRKADGSRHRCRR